MITHAVSVSSKGQVVLPKEVRLALKTNNIIFEIIDEQILIKPVRNVAGSLSHYKKSYEDFSQVRDQVWTEATDDR